MGLSHWLLTIFFTKDDRQANLLLRAARGRRLNRPMFKEGAKPEKVIYSEAMFRIMDRRVMAAQKKCSEFKFTALLTISYVFRYFEIIALRER